MALLNLLATIGSVIFAIGFLLTLSTPPPSCNNGTPAGPDPWGGSTLEWFAPSPPPVHNFDLVPDVRSDEPLHDIRDAIRRRGTRWTPPPADPADRSPSPSPVAAGEAGRRAERPSGARRRGAELGRAARSRPTRSPTAPEDENDAR